MINVSFLTEVQQNFKYTFLDVFFSKESENDNFVKICIKFGKNAHLKRKTRKTIFFYSFLAKRTF